MSSHIFRDRVDEVIRGFANPSLHAVSPRDAPWTTHERSLTGQVVGQFRLEEQIGTGGMGVVYRAERADGVKQSVAIKLVSSTLEAAARHRFEREAQLLARLEHPSIARLIDAGIDDGRAWIAIEFVRGERIDRYCQSRRLPPRDIVRLLIRLTDAVGAAHRMLVVHSDIKPANVLVTPEGMPKLVDSAYRRRCATPARWTCPPSASAACFRPTTRRPSRSTATL